VTRRASVAAAFAVALLAAGGGWARADRETAEYFAKRAEKALKASDAKTAVEQYRRAIAEDAEYLPAHVGLGEALLASGLPGDGAAALRAAVDLAAKVKPLPPAWVDLVAKAKQRLATVDTGGTSIEKIQRAYVDALVALADRSKKDRGLAERALRRALEVSPGDTAIEKRLGALGVEAPAAAIVVFDGTSFDDFIPKPDDDKGWQIDGGVLRGGQQGKANSLQSSRIFDGDLDVRMEARLVKSFGDSPKLGLIAAGNPGQIALIFGVHEESVFFDHEFGPSKKVRLWEAMRRSLKPTFEPSQWNRYEMRLRANEVTFLVNGNVLRKEKRPKERREGTVGVLAQDARIEVRAFDVVRR